MNKLSLKQNSEVVLLDELVELGVL